MFSSVIFTECELCLTDICYVLFLAVSFTTLQYEYSDSIICVAVQHGLCLAVSFIMMQYQYDLFRVVPFITVQYGCRVAV